MNMQISLTAARVNANLTQKQAADKMNIDKSTLSKWENGKTSPSAPQLFDLCEIYGCSIDDIFLNRKFAKSERMAV